MLGGEKCFLDLAILVMLTNVVGSASNGLCMYSNFS